MQRAGVGGMQLVADIRATVNELGSEGLVTVESKNLPGGNVSYIVRLVEA
jgi:hypothetical protein